jgi:CBS domain-containing protein
MKVRDVMTSEVRAVRADVPLKDVAELLVTHGVSGVPVVDEEGVVLGVVSETDILFKEHPGELSEGVVARVLHRGRQRELDAKHDAHTAGEAMSSPAIVIRPGADLTNAATLMLERRVNRLPVVDDGQRAGPITGGTLVGIVTRADLVRAFARLDGEVAAEIEQIIRVRQELWARPPEDVTFTVERGEVSLDGKVDFRAHADLLVDEIEAVPGVVAVTSKLAWSLDEPPRSPLDKPTR